MTIEVTCQCGKHFSAKPELAGKRGKCRSCGSPITIPSPQNSPRTTESIPVVCQCGQKVKAKPQMAGKQIGCPVCQQPILVPRTPDPSMPPQSSLQQPFSTDHAFWDSLDQIPSFAEPSRDVPAASRIAGSYIEAAEQELARNGEGARRRTGRRGPAWGPAFISIFGYVVMSAAGIIGVLNLLGGLYLVGALVARDLGAGLVVGFFLLLILGVNTLFWLVIFRVGVALINNERSAVHGLAILLGLQVVLGVCVMSFSVLGGIGYLVLVSALMAPPTIVGYLCLDEFQ